MSNKIMELYNRLRGRAPKLPRETAITARNINDITISVKEGLSDTKEIHITSWNPAIASALFWEIRGGIRDQGKADAYEAVALMKAKQYLTEAFEANLDEKVP